MKDDDVDPELEQLEAATIEARRLATEALDALRAPQTALRAAAADHVESLAVRRVQASRRGSLEVMAQLSDDDVAELRAWTDEQVALVRSEVESDIEACDFWITESPALSVPEVNSFGAALMPRPNDSKSGLPHALVLLFERSLLPLRRGLVVVGFADPSIEAEPRLEAALVRAWRSYREMAIECLAKWADVEDKQRAAAARYQEVRWERALEVDIAALRARHEAEDRAALTFTLEAAAAAAASPAEALVADVPEHLDLDAFVRTDSETLVPLLG